MLSTVFSVILSLICVHNQLFVTLASVSHYSESVGRTLTKLVPHLGRHFVGRAFHICQLSPSCFYLHTSNSEREMIYRDSQLYITLGH